MGQMAALCMAGSIFKKKCLRARVRVSALSTRSIRLSRPISKVECVELHLRSNNHAQDKLEAISR